MSKLKLLNYCYINMHKNTIITKSQLENRRHPYSSAHLKTQTQVQKIMLRETNKLPPLVKSKGFFLQQLLRHQTSTNSLLDKNHSKSAQSLISNKNQNLTIAKGVTSVYSSPKKGKLIFNIGQTRKIRREYLVLYTSNEQSKEKVSKIQRQLVNKLKIIDSKQGQNEKQMKRTQLYSKEPIKNLSGLIANSKKKKMEQLKRKQKNSSTGVIKIKNLFQINPTNKTENVSSSRTKPPEQLKLKKLLKSCVISQKFQKYKYTTQYQSGQTTIKNWKTKNQRRSTLNNTLEYPEEENNKNYVSQYFKPWNNTDLSQTELYNPFRP